MSEEEMERLIAAIVESKLTREKLNQITFQALMYGQVNWAVDGDGEVEIFPIGTGIQESSDE